MKKLLGLFAMIITLLLAACSQTPTPTDPSLDSQYVNTNVIDHVEDAIATTSGVYVIGDFYDIYQRNNDGIRIHKYDFNGNVLWSKLIQSSGFDSAASIAAANGTVYTLGDTTGSIAGSLGNYDNVLRAYNESGTVLWTRQFGTSSADFAVRARTNSAGQAIVLSHDNGGITVRRFTPTGVVTQLIRNSSYGALDFTLDTQGNIFILASQTTIHYENKAFILKYSSTGALLSTTFVDSYIVVATSPAITSNGTDIYVSYQAFTGGAWIRKYPNVLSSSTAPTKKVNIPSSEIDSMKVAGGFVYAVGSIFEKALANKYDGNLNLVWSKTLTPTQGSGGMFFRGLATRPDSIYPVGTTSSNNFNLDAFVSKLNTSNGSTLWIN